MTNGRLRTSTAALALAGLIAAPGAQATILFDQNVTPDIIFGSGNDNGGFTVHQANGVELGLRGKLRHNAAGAPENTFNSNGDGTYSFAAGVAPTQSFPTAVWSFEWSVNTDFADTSGANLNDFSYALALDSDPSLGVSLGALNGGLPNPFDPINGANPGTGGTVQWDHAIGDNTTGNGGGTSISNGVSDAAGYATLIANNNVAQNSWKPHWFIAGFDPTVDGTYDISLAAFDGNSNEVARTSIQIIVGNGGAPVPGPATLGLLGAGLLGLGLSRRRNRLA